MAPEFLIADPKIQFQNQPCSFFFVLCLTPAATSSIVLIQRDDPHQNKATSPLWVTTASTSHDTMKRKLNHSQETCPNSGIKGFRSFPCFSLLFSLLFLSHRGLGLDSMKWNVSIGLRSFCGVGDGWAWTCYIQMSGWSTAGWIRNSVQVYICLCGLLWL